MPIPHPHGNASGQIAHNSVYGTADTPGSVGGRFVGFGEQATSEIANRSCWALSENVDYIYQELLGDKAIPTGASHTTGASPEATYQITGEVFVGDATYPTGTQGTPAYREGMLLLFAVLDDQYNELQDGSGNEIRVQEVRDSADSADVYKTGGGWYTNPTLHFEAVNPVTGAVVTADYAIPALTPIRILYGERGSMEGMPVDIFTRYKVFSANEVEAGALFQDGTRPMTGDLDFDGNDAINLDEVKGKSSEALDILSIGGDLNLVGGAGLTFKDQFVTTPVPFSETGHTALIGSGLTNSMLAAINGAIVLNKGWHGNRTMQVGGAITYDDPSGAVTLPAGMTVAVNGTGLDVGGKNIPVATTGADRYGVIDANGDFVERLTQGAVLVTDVVVTVYQWDTATFTRKDDLRWQMDAHTGCIDFTVSSVRGGADFDNLEDPLRIMAELSNFTGTPLPVGGFRIVVYDALNVTSSPTVPAGLSHLSIVGAGGPSRARLQFSHSNLNDGIDLNGVPTEMSNLTVRYTMIGAMPGAAQGLIVNPGDDSTFKNLSFANGAATACRHFVRWNSGQTASRILFDQCSGILVAYGFVNAEDATSVSNVTVRKCVFWGNFSGGFASLPHDYNTVEDCQFGALYGTNGQGSATGPAVLVGHAGKVTGCYITSDNNPTQACIEIEPTATGEPTTGDLTFTVRDNFIHGYGKAFSTAFTASTRNVHGVFDGNTVLDYTYGVWIENTGAAVGEVSTYNVTNNHFDGGASGAYSTIHADVARNLVVSGNSFNNHGGVGSRGINLVQLNIAVIDGNTFRDCGEVGIYVGEGVHTGPNVESVMISNNSIIGLTGGTAYAIHLYGAPDVTIDGNTFGPFGTSPPDRLVYVERGATYDPDHIAIRGNNFHHYNGEAIHFDAELVWGVYEVSNNSFIIEESNTDYAIAVFSGCVQITNNRFTGNAGTTHDGKAIYVFNGAGGTGARADGTSIRGNYFRHCGRDITTGNVIRVIDNSGTANAITIADNVFEFCGSTTTTITTLSLITVQDVAGCAITGNLFLDSYGPQNGAGVLRCIDVQGLGASLELGRHDISGNHFFETESTASGRMTTGTHYNIYCGCLGAKICSNTFHHSLNFVLAGTAEYRIYSSAAYSLISNNVIGEFDRTGPTNYGVYASGGGSVISSNLFRGIAGIDLAQSPNNVVHSNHLEGGDIISGGDYDSICNNRLGLGDIQAGVTGASPAQYQSVIGNYLYSGHITWGDALGDGQYDVVMGNNLRIGHITNSVTSAQAVIIGNKLNTGNLSWTGASLVVVGNQSTIGAITIGGASGIVVGNVAPVGTTTVGTHGTSGNV